MDWGKCGIVCHLKATACLQESGSAVNITIPEFSLDVLVCTTGSSKSTFAQAHFKLTEVLSSDVFRRLVSDDETDQFARGGPRE